MNRKVMLELGKIQLHVPLRPIQIGFGKIDGHHLSSASGCRIDGKGACVTEQVKHFFRLRSLFHHAAGDAMIQKKTRIQIIAKIYNKLKAVFLYHEFLPIPVQFFVLGGAVVLALAEFQENIFRGCGKDFAD